MLLAIMHTDSDAKFSCLKASSAPPVTMKHRAVEPINKFKKKHPVELRLKLGLNLTALAQMTDLS